MAFGRRRSRAAVLNPNDVAAGKNALTAAGQRLRRRPQSTGQQSASQQWQARSFFYYDAVGEIRYASQFYARGLSSLELGAGEIVLNEKTRRPEVKPTDDPVALELLDRIQDPGGGRSGLLGSYGRLMFLAGECYLFVSRNPDTDSEQWEVLSTEELRVDAGGSYRRLKAPSMQAETYREPKDEDYAPIEDEEAVAYRLWKRHPRFSDWPDAPMQAVLDIAEELLLLTQGIRADVKSRLAQAGILFIDERVSPKPLEAVPDEDPAEDILLVDLTQAMTTAIADEGSASSVVPLLVRVSVPEAMKLEDLVYHLRLADPSLYLPEVGLREEAIKRLAISLDMPPEVLMGYGDSNHWSGWLIDDQAWTGHLQPVADEFVNTLSAVYYRPALREAGVEGWERFCITYDATSVLSNPNKGKDAKDLHDRLVVSDSYLRESAGVDEEDAPAEGELRRRIGVLLKNPGLATGDQASPDGGTVDSADARDEVEQQPPEQPAEQEALPEIVASGNGYSAAARLLGAADAALLHARIRAGNKIVSTIRGHPETLRIAKGARPGQVAAALGRDRVRALLGIRNERVLVEGCHHFVVDMLRQFDIVDENVAFRVADNIERHAARTIYDEKPSRFSQAFVNYLAELSAR